MATSHNLSRLTPEAKRFHIVDEAPIGAVELAALDVASRPLDKCRAELTAGDYKVWAKLLITGGLTVREATVAATPADVLGVLAWVLSKLPEKGRTAVAAAVLAGETVAMGKAEREAAKALCEPTRGTTVRSGAITGTLAVDRVR